MGNGFALGASRRVPPVEGWQRLCKQDLRELKEWVCTDPAHSVYSRNRGSRIHPRPWELEVQSYFRDIKVRCEGLVWVGRDGDGIAAMAHLTAAPELGGTLIAAVGRAQRLAHCHVGDALLDECLRLMSDEGTGVTSDFALARIHHENKPSKAAFERHGFAYMGPDGQDLEMWGLELQ